ncbi:MAG: glycosyltransferase family 2 protein [Lachnospiraceae bacterium]|nr:glycosyltransferase family 2 protein [Lachnospiraceae bacterium]
MKTAILLATYNSEKYIGEMISSLLNQTFTDFVCYIHDDGSGDGTLKVLEGYAASHPDKFYILRDETSHLGAKGNFLHLLKSVEADTYFFADADDVWMKDKMEKSLDALGRLGDAGPCAVFSDMKVTDENLNVTHGSFIRALDRDPSYHSFQEIIMDNPAAGCTLCFNRACRDAAIFATDEKADEKFAQASSLVEMHDVWVLLTAALLGRVDVMDEPLVYYRQHGDNEMGAKTESVAKKAGRNMSGAVAGDLASKKKDYYDNAKNLARAGLLLSDLSEDKRRILEGFASLSGKNKLYRISFLKNNGFRRKKRSLWIWLWA